MAKVFVSFQHFCALAQAGDFKIRHLFKTKYYNITWLACWQHQYFIVKTLFDATQINIEFFVAAPQIYGKNSIFSE